MIVASVWSFLFLSCLEIVKLKVVWHFSEVEKCMVDYLFAAQMTRKMRALYLIGS